ncbi:MAG: Holliday junction resolvase RuvX [Candidatus Zambryskibacteria bacterium]|nr:Holliday junction resolvase RuvX [Candidatus Zambryskibacteria bacterium]
MAIDYGAKRVGVASTDESGLFAIPRMVLENNDQLLEKVIKFKEEHHIEKIVIGESRNFEGDYNIIQEEIDRFSNELEKFGVEVISHPEILTTKEARELQGNTAMTDASAAALILKSYIDSN